MRRPGRSCRGGDTPGRAGRVSCGHEAGAEPGHRYTGGMTMQTSTNGTGERDDAQGYVIAILIGGAVALGAWCAYRIGTTGPDVPAGDIPAPPNSFWHA